LLKWSQMPCKKIHPPKPTLIPSSSRLSI
jgi:hypothetical protein